MHNFMKIATSPPDFPNFINGNLCFLIIRIINIWKMALALSPSNYLLMSVCVCVCVCTYSISLSSTLEICLLLELEDWLTVALLLVPRARFNLNKHRFLTLNILSECTVRTVCSFIQLYISIIRTAQLHSSLFWTVLLHSLACLLAWIRIYIDVGMLQ